MGNSMVETLRGACENVIASPAFISRSCADPDCRRARLWWLQIRHHGVRVGDAWFCSPSCLERELQGALRRCFDDKQGRGPRVHRMPLGLLMFSRGFVNESQLQAALLKQQREQRGKIGQWLQRLGFATEKQVVTALALQYATPVLAFPAEVVPPRILPIALLNSLRVMPVRFSSSQQLLYIAFCSPVDHSFLQSIEKMTGWRASPCLVSDACMDKLLENAEERSTAQTHYFARMASPGEVAHVAVSYAIRIGAKEVRFAKCGSLVWVRLLCREEHADMIFDVADRLQLQSSGGLSKSRGM